MKPTPLGRHDLVASFYTLSGAPNGQPARFGLQERLTAARAAGWAGIGMAAFDYLHLLDQGEHRESLRDTVAAAGLTVTEIEFLPVDLRRAEGEPSDVERVLFDMADVFGSSQLNVGLVGSLDSGDEARAARALRSIGQAAAEKGMRVAFEFMPFGAVKSIESALRLVEAAGCDNVGVLVDAYHFFRGGSRLESLDGVPASLIAGLQLDDVPAQAPDDLLTETRQHRRLPGDGELPLEDLVRAVDRTGADVPVGVELLSTDLQQLPVAEAATTVFAATTSVLRRARGGPGLNQQGA
jgi:sugar phosphate isomerase/epimerase